MQTGGKATRSPLAPIVGRRFRAFGHSPAKHRPTPTAASTRGGVENPDDKSKWFKEGAEAAKKQNGVITDRSQREDSEDKDEIKVKPVTFYDERDPQNKVPVLFQDKEGNVIEPGRFKFDPTMGWVSL
jgi:hypothetical protein